MGGEHLMRLVEFRNYLIKNEEVAERYAEITRDGALASENDILRYSAFKVGFMEYNLILALIAHEQK